MITPTLNRDRPQVAGTPQPGVPKWQGNPGCYLRSSIPSFALARCNLWNGLLRRRVTMHSVGGVSMRQADSGLAPVGLLPAISGRGGYSRGLRPNRVLTSAPPQWPRVADLPSQADPRGFVNFGVGPGSPYPGPTNANESRQRALSFTAAGRCLLECFALGRSLIILMPEIRYQEQWRCWLGLL